MTVIACTLILAAWALGAHYMLARQRHRNAQAAWQDMRVTESLVDVALELGYRMRLRNETETQS